MQGDNKAAKTFRNRRVAPVDNHSQLTPSVVITSDNKAMRGLDRTPKAQALVNIAQALRALELAPRPASDFVPHPLDIVRAELVNVARYVALIDCE